MAIKQPPPTDPWTDEGVLYDARRRVAEGSPLPDLTDVVLIDRLIFRLQAALMREQSTLEEQK